MLIALLDTRGPGVDRDPKEGRVRPVSEQTALKPSHRGQKVGKKERDGPKCHPAACIFCLFTPQGEETASPCSCDFYPGKC